MSIRERIRNSTKGASPENQARIVAQERASIVAESWDKHPARNLRGEVTFSFKDEEVTIGHIEMHEENGVPSVWVWTGPKEGGPQYRIINPPVLVEDSNGSVEMKVSTGTGRSITKKFKEDPVRAVAEGIASSKKGRMR